MNAMNKHSLLFVVVAAFVIGGIWWGLTGETSQDPSVGDTTSPTGERSAPPTVAPRVWHTGHMFAPTNASARFGLQMAGQAAPLHAALGEAATWRIEGTLELAHLPAEPVSSDGGAWMGARLVAPKAKLNNAMLEVGDLDEEDPASSLAGPWAFRVDDRGRVAEVRFASGTAVMAQSLVASLLYALQLASPERDEAAWRVTEIDANGPYEASYVGGADGVEKRWSLAVKDGAANAAAAAGLRHSTQVAFTFADHALAGLEYRQTGSMALGLMGGGDRDVPFRSTIGLKRLGQGDVNWTADMVPSAMHALNLAPKAHERAPKREPSAVLADAARDGRDARIRARLRDELTASLRHDAGLSGAFKARLLKGGDPEIVERTIIEALASAGTPGAEKVFVDMLGDGAVEARLQDRMLWAAVLMPNPSPEFLGEMSQLMKTAQGLARARLAVVIGAVVNRLGTSPGAVGASQVEALVEEADARLAPDDSETSGEPPVRPASLAERINWLTALGNTGSATALDTILGALVDPEQPVRVAAAYALRFQDPNEALGPMTQVMRDESSPGVREALVSAARDMGPQAVAFVKRALLTDPVESVRLEAAYGVAMWNASAPGMRAILAEALALEKAPVVREALQNHLEPGRMVAPLAGTANMGSHGATDGGP